MAREHGQAAPINAAPPIAGDPFRQECAAAGPSLISSWTPGQTVAATLVVSAVAVGFLLVYLCRDVLFFLFIGTVVATALRPPIGWLERRGISHSTATVSVFALLVGFLLAVLLGGLPILASQATNLWDALPKIYADLRERIGELPGPLAERVAPQLPKSFPVAINQGDGFGETLSSVAEALDYGEPVIQAGFAAVAVLLLAFYWSLGEERTVRGALLWVPTARRDAARDLFAAIRDKVGACVRGQGILCLAMAGLSFLAFLWIGLPYPLALAVIAGMLEVVPVFGPILGAVPGVLVAFSVAPDKVLWVIGAAIVIQQTENYVLVPRVMGKSAGMHAMVTLLAIVAFGALFGVPGMILAIPLAAVIQLLLERFLLSPAALEPTAPAGRDFASRLQYRASQLVQDARLQFREAEEDASIAPDRLEEAVEAIARELEQALAQRQTALSSVEAPSGTVVYEVQA